MGVSEFRPRPCESKAKKKEKMMVTKKCISTISMVGRIVNNLIVLILGSV